MKARRLGRSQLEVSELGLGTWQTVGSALSLDESKALVSTALELGINFFDTADVYADGAAERALGEALRGHSRSRYVVATKCFFPWPGAPEARGLSAKHVNRAVDRSLRNLGLEVIDLMQCHRFDPEVPLEETCEAMAALVKAGKIRHWGLGRCTAAQLREMTAAASRVGVPPVSDQHFYNLLNREVETEIAPACGELGLGLIVYSALAQGVLTGKYADGQRPAGSRAANPAARLSMWDLGADRAPRIARWAEFAREQQTSLVSVALGYVLSQPQVASVLIGASSPSQLRDTVAAASLPFHATRFRSAEQR